jgi:hypothetical protein
MKRMLLGGLSVLVLVGCTGAPQAKYPVDGLQGNYTVAAYHFWDVVERDGSVSTYAVAEANKVAAKLRQSGQTAYVADLGPEAVVAMGSYPSLETARSAAAGLGTVLQKTMGLPQMRVTWVGPGAGSAQPTNAQLVMQPVAVDLKVLKDRVHARHEHRLRLPPRRIPAAPPPAPVGPLSIPSP